MLNSCEGKSVIVTGASKGICKGSAAVFARHGAKVLVVARNLDQADACAAELRVGGRQVSAFVGDVTNRSEMEEMARVAVERNGGIDILCANAEIFPQSKLEDMSGTDCPHSSASCARPASSSPNTALQSTPFCREILRLKGSPIWGLTTSGPWQPRSL